MYDFGLKYDKLKIELINNNKNNPDFEKLKNRAIEIFPTIVELGVKFKRLHDINNRFSKSVLEEFFFNLPNYDWERFQHMMYLIAFGNNSDDKAVWKEADNLKISFNQMLINFKDEKIIEEKKKYYKTYSDFIDFIIQNLSKQNK